MARRYRGSGYSAYRGGGRRSGARTVLRWVIVFLLAVLIVAVGVLLFLQNNLIYSDEGVKLVLPWSQDTAEPAPSGPAPTVSQPVVVTVSPETDPQEEAVDTLRAVSVSQTALLGGSAAEQVRAAGGNAVIITMKQSDGALAYVSSVPLAVSAQASGADPGVNLAVSSLIREEDIYTIARVTCFQDHVLPGYDANLAIHTNSGYRWIDHTDVRWSSPANQIVRDYLTDLCVELAQMGFDEILLDHCGFPMADEGTLSYIKKGDAYPAGSLDTVITPFLTQVKMALEAYDTKLSVYTDKAVLEGTDQDTGLTAANLLDNADRIWLPAAEVTQGIAFVDTEEQAAAEDRIVSVDTTAGAENGAWAIMN